MADTGVQVAPCVSDGAASPCTPLQCALRRLLRSEGPAFQPSLRPERHGRHALLRIVSRKAGWRCWMPLALARAWLLLRIFLCPRLNHQARLRTQLLLQSQAAVDQLFAHIGASLRSRCLFRRGRRLKIRRVPLHGAAVNMHLAPLAMKRQGAFRISVRFMRKSSSAGARSGYSMLHDAKRDAGRIRRRMVYLVVRHNVLGFVEVVTARIQVAVKSGKVAAAHLDA